MTRGFSGAVQTQLGIETFEHEGQLVLRPGSVNELRSIVLAANEHRTKLAVQPIAAAVPNGYGISLGKLNALRSTDADSRLLHVECGATMAKVETAARSRGWTFGTTQDDATTVLEWLSRGTARSEKDNDPVYQHVAGAEVVLANGELMSIRPAPRRAVGPDLLPAIVAARGRLGILTSVHVAARSESSVRYTDYEFPTNDAALAARAWIRGRGVRPRVATVHGRVLHLELAGSNARNAAAERVVEDVVRSRGGVAVDANEAQSAGNSSKRLLLSRVIVKLAQRLDPEGVLQP